MKKKISFNDLINGDKPVLVDFSAEWCGPCKAMAPVLKEVKKKIGKKVVIAKIDVDQNRTLANQMQIRGVPTFVLYNKGKIQWRQAGMQTAKQLLHVIENAV